MLSPYRVSAAPPPPPKPARVNVRARVHHLRRKLIVALYERKHTRARCRRCQTPLWMWEGGSMCPKCSGGHRQLLSVPQSTKPLTIPVG